MNLRRTAHLVHTAARAALAVFRADLSDMLPDLDPDLTGERPLTAGSLIYWLARTDHRYQIKIPYEGRLYPVLYTTTDAAPNFVLLPGDLSQGVFWDAEDIVDQTADRLRLIGLMGGKP